MNHFIKVMGGRFLVLLVALSCSTFSFADEAAKKINDAKQTVVSGTDATIKELQGTWLVDAMELNKQHRMTTVWNSKLTIKENSFTLSKPLDAKEDLTGKITLGKSENENTIDLALDGLDLSKTGSSFNIPKAKMLGIYKLDKDQFTVCINIDPKSPSALPEKFQSHDNKTLLLSFCRADASFQNFAKNVTVNVKDSEGKPAVGAKVFMFTEYLGFKNKEGMTDPQWQYYETVTTDSDGNAQYPYKNLKVIHTISVRDQDRKLSGLGLYTPFKLQNGEASIQMKPECKITASIQCPELEKVNQQIGWANAYLQFEGSRIAGCMSESGEFHFIAPPGKYAARIYGTNIADKTIDIIVPESKQELVLDPIQLKANKLALLKGNPAPEFDEKFVVGWKGEKVKLADLKGKYVLIEFWGYWCGPCVHSMPVLIELHEKYHDKGLAIVGVHLDLDGEVDTVEKLDEKTADSKKKLWKGKELPFPNVLTCGTLVEANDGELGRVGIAQQYGIQGYPTTVLIDREGKVVGDFVARRSDEACAEMEKLLGLAKDEKSSSVSDRATKQ